MALVGIPPAPTEETDAFWEAAGEGRLLAQHCPVCDAWSFPPRGTCRSCRSREVELLEVTGPGVVYSFTVNHQRWLPDLAVPYAVVLVEFASAPGVRVAGRIRGCKPEDVFIGQQVEIGFEPGPGDSHVPSFVVVDP